MPTRQPTSAPATVPAPTKWDETAISFRDAAVRDTAVLQAVFDDMLSKDNSESPVEWHGDQSQPVYVSKSAPKRRPVASELLSRNDEQKWKALTNAQLGAAAEAADDLEPLTQRMKLGFAPLRLRSTIGLACQGGRDGQAACAG
jgi:hypothetical protein